MFLCMNSLWSVSLRMRFSHKIALGICLFVKKTEREHLKKTHFMFIKSTAKFHAIHKNRIVSFCILFYIFFVLLFQIKFMKHFHLRRDSSFWLKLWNLLSVHDVWSIVSKVISNSGSMYKYLNTNWICMSFIEVSR